MLAIARPLAACLLLIGCSSSSTNPAASGGSGGGSTDAGQDSPDDDAAGGIGGSGGSSGAGGGAGVGGDAGVECTTACLPQQNATVACLNGKCTITQCTSGWDDCDKVLGNGCEVPTAGDTANCGACGKACASNNGTVACATGKCAVTGCTAGYADCNSSGDDGCETSLQVAASCGGCTTPCASGELCNAGGATPKCVKDCGSLTLCGTTCANTSTDPQNCNGCGAACSGPNATYSCVNAACTVASCAPNFADCDGKAATGCEVDLLASASHCGACNEPCTGAETCVNGQCNPVVALAVGPFSSCSLRYDGQVACWGLNDEGAIGDGTLMLRSLPTPVPGLSAKAITAVQNVAAMCAVTKAGKLLCWGRNQAAEVGDGTQQSPRIVPTAVTSDDAAFAARTFTMVSGFASGACALDNQGEVWCWGYNQFGQAGSGTLNDFVKRATRVPGLTGVIAVSAALSHVCVLVQGGTVRCWGRGTEGQLGDGLSQTSVAPVIVSGLSGVTNLAASQGATCAVAGGGDLYCWGSNLYGAVGNGSLLPAPTPVKSSLTGVQALGMGRLHVLAKTATGSYGWGYNALGQLLKAPTTQETTPVSITALPAQTTALFGGAGSMCAIAAGQAWCWAHDATGQLGVRDLLVMPTAASVSDGTAPLSGLTHVAVGGVHSCVASASVVSCAGESSALKLGQSPPADASAVPLPVSLPSATGGPIRGLALGGQFSCALKGADGSREAWCWGTNGAGQLGTGTTTGAGPAKVVGLTDPSALATGREFGCALVGSTPHCWGRNAQGELGRATTSTYEAPGAVVGVSNAIAIATGDAHACALLSTAEVSCWGHNSIGQLGTGTTGGVSAPAKIPGLTGVTHLGAGPGFTCATVGAAGDVRCWGANDAGQLGNGNTTNQSTPQPTSISGATALALGGGHACALLTGGTVKCWGQNANGQLGDGTRTSSTSGVVVSGLSNATAITAAPVPHFYGQHTCARRSDGSVACWGHNAHGRLMRGESMLIATPTLVNIP